MIVVIEAEVQLLPLKPKRLPLLRQEAPKAAAPAPQAAQFGGSADAEYDESYWVAALAVILLHLPLLTKA